MPERDRRIAFVEHQRRHRPRILRTYAIPELVHRVVEAMNVAPQPLPQIVAGQQARSAARVAAITGGGGEAVNR